MRQPSISTFFSVFIPYYNYVSLRLIFIVSLHLVLCHSFDERINEIIVYLFIYLFIVIKYSARTIKKYLLKFNKLSQGGFRPPSSLPLRNNNVYRISRKKYGHNINTGHYALVKNVSVLGLAKLIRAYSLRGVPPCHDEEAPALKLSAMEDEWSRAH